ncbi:dirigent protein 4-like [Macadamia integrifolia]|uniref:dirigent protein 4-like n=1 Tax=Macadamia integrifolia TaxID=60698 RepID=UPI001C4EF830|nr:dirigent protein 4-like [Macadamia integrifolia]
MGMKVMLAFLCALFLCLSTLPTHSAYYYTQKLQDSSTKEKVTHLHFFLHDTLSGKDPSAVLVAQSNNTNDHHKSATPFGSVYAIDDLLTEGPELSSNVIGNAQGLYASTDKDTLSIVMYIDFGFTSGKFNGSSFSVFSRNPVLDTGVREVAIVGGRKKFRMARGFAELKTQYFNGTNGDAIIEYDVTLFHH